MPVIGVQVYEGDGLDPELFDGWLYTVDVHDPSYPAIDKDATRHETLTLPQDTKFFLTAGVDTPVIHFAFAQARKDSLASDRYRTHTVKGTRRTVSVTATIQGHR